VISVLKWSGEVVGTAEGSGVSYTSMRAHSFSFFESFSRALPMNARTVLLDDWACDSTESYDGKGHVSFSTRMKRGARDESVDNVYIARHEERGIVDIIPISVLHPPLSPCQTGKGTNCGCCVSFLRGDVFILSNCFIRATSTAHGRIECGWV
jgi:hypothetical protein